MGLDDRNDLRVRRTPAQEVLRPPAGPHAAVILGWGVIGVLALAGLCKAFECVREGLWHPLGPTPTAEAAKALGEPVPPSDPSAAPSSGLPVVALDFNKCTAANGRVSYSKGPCPAGSRRSPLQLRPDPKPAQPTGTAAADEPDAATQQCRRLAQRISQLDARTRRPQDPVYQDWIRTERQYAREQQLRLSCA